MDATPSVPMVLPPAWALDLDGVVWLADHPIEGSAQAVSRLRAAGARVVFVTNFSWGKRDDIADKLTRHGIDPGDDVITSSMAAASFIEAGQRVLVVGGPGIIEAVESRAAEAVPVGDGRAGSAPVDAVLVGLDPQFDYRAMTIAATAVRRGARLLATNDDATYPTAAGPVPGGGAVLAAIAVAAGVTPVVAGKPNEPIAALVRERCGDTGVMVGDRPDTDGRFAHTLGWEFALVLSGTVGADDLPVTPTPDRIAPTLADLVDDALAGRRSSR